MENIEGVFVEEEIRKPRFYFRLDEGVHYGNQTADLKLVMPSGRVVATLFMLENRGGSWRLNLKQLEEEFIEKFYDTFDLDGVFLHAERDTR